MDERTLLILCFGGGVLVQATLMLRGPVKIQHFLLCVAGGLLGFLPGRNEHDYELLQHVLFCYIAFGIFFACSFKRQLLAPLSDRAVLAFTAILWFAYLTIVYQGTLFDHVLMCVFAFPSVAMLCVIFHREALGPGWQMAIYAWFLTIIAALSLMHYSFDELRLFDGNRPVPWLGPLDGVIAGMACITLVINATFFFMLWPIPRRGQSFQDRKREWFAYLDLLEERFADERSPLLFTLGLVALLVVALLVVQRTHWVEPAVAIHVAIITVMLIRPRGIPDAPTRERHW
jgi:hypothetical protein